MTTLAKVAAEAQEKAEELAIAAAQEKAKVRAKDRVPAREVDTKYSGITRNDFPEGFVFGTGTAAYQVEGAAAIGGRGISVWDEFTMDSPGRITDGDNGNIALDTYHKYKEDIKMMKSMGFDAYRFSISWARVIPGGKISLGVNREGIDYYNDLINTCLANGLQPYVTLFHWDLPYTLAQEYGGFLSPRIVDDFRDYADLCFWEFGDRVKHWTTLNEPWSYCELGYVAGTFPPGKTIYIVDENSKSDIAAVRSAIISDTANSLSNLRFNTYIPPPPTILPASSLPLEKRSPADTSDKPYMTDFQKQVFIAAKYMCLAHSAAVGLYRRKYKAHQNGVIGITLVTTWFEPLTDSQEDKDAARRAFDSMFAWFLEPVLKGSWPKTMQWYMPDEAEFSEQESKMLVKNKIDFLGVNYYSARYVTPRTDTPNPYEHPFLKYQNMTLHEERDGVPIGPVPGVAWIRIVPWGIKSLLNKINELYNNDEYNVPSVYITENGWGEIGNHKLTPREVLPDTTRVKYHRDHLGNIMDVINEGKSADKKLDIKGYFAWSLADNFEWTDGYTVRFGLMYIDYVNHLKRYPKHSALWFSQFLAGQVQKSYEEEDDEENQV